MGDDHPPVLPGARPAFTSIGMGLDYTTWVVDDTQRATQLFGPASASLNDPRAISKISVASAAQIWGLDASGQPVSLQPDSGAWTNMGTATLASIDGAPDGTVCGVELVAQQPPAGSRPGTPPPPPIGRPVQWNGGSWEKMDDDNDQHNPRQPVRQIAVGDRNTIWSIDPDGMVLRRQGRNNWQPMPALPSFTDHNQTFYPTAVRLCASTDGSLCAVGSYNYAYRLRPNASAWDYYLDAKLTEIASTNGNDYAGLITGQMLSRAGKPINDVMVWGYSLQTMPPPPPPVPALSWRQGIASWGSQIAPAVAVYDRGLYSAGQQWEGNAAARFFFWGALSWNSGEGYFDASAASNFVAIGSTPALATFRGALYCAFQASDSGHALCVTRSFDGATWWWPPTSVPGIYIGSHFAARVPEKILRPLLAATLTFFLLSLIGIPMTGGFFAKFYVFRSHFCSPLCLMRQPRQPSCGRWPVRSRP